MRRLKLRNEIQVLVVVVATSDVKIQKFQYWSSRISRRIGRYLDENQWFKKWLTLTLLDRNNGSISKPNGSFLENIVKQTLQSYEVTAPAPACATSVTSDSTEIPDVIETVKNTL